MELQKAIHQLAVSFMLNGSRNVRAAMKMQGVSVRKALHEACSVRSRWQVSPLQKHGIQTYSATGAIAARARGFRLCASQSMCLIVLRILRWTHNFHMTYSFSGTFWASIRPGIAADLVQCFPANCLYGRQN